MKIFSSFYAIAAKEILLLRRCRLILVMTFLAPMATFTCAALYLRYVMAWSNEPDSQFILHNFEAILQFKYLGDVVTYFYPAKEDDVMLLIEKLRSIARLEPKWIISAVYLRLHLFINIILIPLIPTILCAHSITVERSQKTMEPIMAVGTRPISIITGKIFSISMITLLVIAAGYLSAILSMNYVTQKYFSINVLPDAQWTCGLFCTGFSLCLTGMLLTFLVGMHLGDMRALYHITMVLVPLVTTLLAWFVFRSALTGIPPSEVTGELIHRVLIRSTLGITAVNAVLFILNILFFPRRKIL